MSILLFIPVWLCLLYEEKHIFVVESLSISWSLSYITKYVQVIEILLAFST